MNAQPVPLLERAEKLIAAGHIASAIQLLKSEIASGRAGILSRIALGRVLLRAGCNDEALGVFREAVALSPGIAETALALGDGLLASGHLPVAIAEFQRALTIDPHSHAARHALGCAWLDAGEAEKASEIMLPLTFHDGPYRQSALGKLREAEELKSLTRSSPGYVRHLFDQFSADYDRNMVDDLAYHAPQILRSLSDLLAISAAAPFDILDLGCGTGLAGQMFKPLARHIEGVDLSPLMIEQAKRRGIYDELTVADLETFLGQSQRQFDLLLAADTLVYFGDLSAVFQGARRSMRPHGHFVFTVEKSAESGFALGPKRRYRHAADYIRGGAESAGLVCMGILDCSPRTEAGVPVEGLAVALQNG